MIKLVYNKRIKERTFSSAVCSMGKTWGFKRSSPPKKFRTGISFFNVIVTECSTTSHDLCSPYSGEQPYKQ
jgi:hypothetical protein